MYVYIYILKASTKSDACSSSGARDADLRIRIMFVYKYINIPARCPLLNAQQYPRPCTHTDSHSPLLASSAATFTAKVFTPTRFVCICIIYICIYVCMYVYIYIVYIYVCTYIYTYTRPPGRATRARRRELAMET